MVPFHMLGMVSYWCASNFVLKTGRFSLIQLQKYRDLEIRVRGPIVRRSIFEIFNFKNAVT